MTASNVRKKIIVIAAMLLLMPCAYSQLIENHALGFLVGTSQYNGDVNMTKAYYRPFPAASLLYKMYFNHHYVTRFSVTYGELQGRDSDFPNQYQQNRKYSFGHNRVYEGAAQVEFNFLEFAFADKRYREKREKFFSPYVVGGIALFFADQLNFSDIFAIPMGVGLKYRVSGRVELNVEWAFRKTFTDNLDVLNTSVPDYDLYKQVWFKETNDWYSILGFSVLFALKQKQSSCTFYNKKPYESRIEKNKGNRKK